MNNSDVDSIKFSKPSKKFFPNEWSDDERMGVLLAPFRPRALNEINYVNKLTFWKNLITKYCCEEKGSANIQIGELKCAFKRNNIKPGCLSVVIDEMMKLGKVQQTTKFMEPPQLTWRGWAQNKFSKALTWPVSKVKDTIWQTPADEINYIILEAVEKQAEDIQKNYSNDQVTSFDEFLRSVQSTLNITAEGTQYALHHLYCNGKAAIESYSFNGNTVMLVKVAGAKQSNSVEITNIEKSIYELSQKEKILTEAVKKIENDIEDTMSKAREYVKDNKKNLAKSQLKKKHALENNLAKNSSILDNIQTLLANIEYSKDNVNILNVYKMGADALKQTNAASGLTAEKVDDILDDIQEVLEDNNEIQNQISVAQFEPTSSVDELALEDELKEILEYEEKKESSATAKLDKSIEDRLKQLNLDSLADLSFADQERVLVDLEKAYSSAL